MAVQGLAQELMARLRTASDLETIYRLQGSLNLLDQLVDTLPFRVGEPEKKPLDTPRGVEAY